jgi:large subunit ribosomal protein L13
MKKATRYAHKEDIKKTWHVIDARDKVLGRLASKIAILLMGKHKTTYTPSVDTGDFVVVINAAKVKITGKKFEEKLYTRYSGYPGGLRTRTFKDLFEQDPRIVITHAVHGMLPKGILGRQMIKKLKVYNTEAHPHDAQMPQVLEV